MRQVHHRISVQTRGKGLYDFTAEVLSWLRSIGASEGLLTILLQHTSASLLVQENADPDVLYDLEQFFKRLVPEDNRLYRHTMEGPDDMPAHIRAALTLTNLSIPVMNGMPAVGTWQGMYVYEHRTHPHTRRLALHYLGD
ncbi:MAG: YjbQ family protein [Bryobacterales bacterium]|nr:YjbQ family protein [Bryobacterales bacterium]